jgi:rsbT antagonist protein RsbS
MRVPILKLGPYLIASVQESLTDADLLTLETELSQKVGQFGSRGVVVDVAALDVMDSFSTRMLRDISQVTRLRGAETVITGIQPEVAFTMVQLGLRLNGVTTTLDLEDSLAYLEARLKAKDDDR